MPVGSKRRRNAGHQPGWGGFRSDLATARKRILQRTDGHHKYFVLFVLVLGLVLRAWRLNEPVSYDEALTWTEYARKSFGLLLSDYTFTSNHILYSALAKISVLVAGMLVLPLAYLFVRMVFNRHIAVIFLCLLAVSSPLVEYSAMARGYSLVWLFTICALLAGRHFVKSENWVSAVLLATSTALGMWAAPVMVYPAVMAYFWTLFMLMTNYQSTLRRRVLKLAGSFLLAGGLASLCYAPVIAMHSLDSLLHHPSLADHTWNHFVNTQQDQAFGVWAYLTGTNAMALSFAGAAAIIYAAYVSAKYRLMLFALALGTLPIVTVQHMVAAPAAWTFSLLVFHMGGAIGLFYLLKAVRDKVAPDFTKGQRTLLGGAAVLLIFGILAIGNGGDDVERFPEADTAAAWVAAHARPGDRLGAQLPWDAPLGFYMACHGADPEMLDPQHDATGNIFIALAPSHGQTLGSVWRNAGLAHRQIPVMREVGQWGRLEMYTPL
mgnify:CR=1 FL=1